MTAVWQANIGKESHRELIMVAHALSSSTQEAESGVEGQPASQPQASQGCIDRSCLKTKTWGEGEKEKKSRSSTLIFRRAVARHHLERGPI